MENALNAFATHIIMVVIIIALNIITVTPFQAFTPQ